MPKKRFSYRLVFHVGDSRKRIKVMIRMLIVKSSQVKSVYLSLLTINSLSVLEVAITIRAFVKLSNLLRAANLTS